MLFIVFSVLMITTVKAKEFSKRGHVHQIDEQPFLEMIQERLSKVDISKEQEKLQRIVEYKIQNPTPIKNVTPAKKNRTFYHDPTYTITEDITLPCGKILHKAGTTINPLEHMNLERRLLFLDARNIRQVQWLRRVLNQRPIEDSKKSPIAIPIEDRIILVAGSPLELQKEIQEKVYFDQQGVLTTRFNIKHTPAIVVQDGLMLKVREVELKKNV
jgi:conjugal transfer pilus assembly protein TraW